MQEELERFLTLYNLHGRHRKLSRLSARCHDVYLELSAPWDEREVTASPSLH